MKEVSLLSWIYFLCINVNVNVSRALTLSQPSKKKPQMAVVGVVHVLLWYGVNSGAQANFGKSCMQEVFIADRLQCACPLTLGCSASCSCVVQCYSYLTLFAQL